MLPILKLKKIEKFGILSNNYSARLEFELAYCRHIEQFPQIVSNIKKISKNKFLMNYSAEEVGENIKKRMRHKTGHVVELCFVVSVNTTFNVIAMRFDL